MRSSLPIVLVLTVSLSLNVLGIAWGLPNYGDWAQDSIALETMEAIAKRFSNGWFDKYPPVHYAVLALFYAPYIIYLLISGGLDIPTKVFPYGLVDPLSTLTHFILIARGVSVVLGVAIVLLVYIAVNEFFDRRSALFAALIVALCYPLVYYSKNANVDVPYLFWALLAIVCFLRLLKYGRSKHYLLFALFATLSICTKDQAYGLFLLSPIPILLIRFNELNDAGQQRPSFLRLVFDRRLLSAAIVATVAFVIAQNIPFNFSGFLKHVHWITGRGVEPYVSYAPTLLGRLHLLLATGAALAQTLTLPIFLLSVFGAVYCIIRFRGPSLPLLFFAATYYLTFINVVGYVVLRFVLPIAIILAFFGGRILAELWQRAPLVKMWRVAVCLIFAYAALFPLQMDLLLMSGDSRYSAERWMKEHFKSGAIVETFAASHLHLGWYYPRFPAHVKVRRSKRETGSQWISHETSPDKVRFPNLYFGTEAPEYIVLKFFPGEVILQKDGIFKELYAGNLGYKLAASFDRATFVPIQGIGVNPRIDIFAKDHSGNSD
jgi:4-amino-4-deoxy-L-arabinose transferase-like glycosyltransferase